MTAHSRPTGKVARPFSRFANEGCVDEAETYATLSGDPSLKIRPIDAAQMVEDLASALTILSFEAKQCRDLISSAPAKGIRGGTIYDALHAEAHAGLAARR